ncbi:MAG TPA: hypothetical protein VNQ90_09000 [Chthoniobacteraceae bacterium]|nr:hypothetical protein [Chthoniobacteraceae bacterium]
MKQRNPGVGKVEEHAGGLGTPTQETVWRRAIELALIEGRDEPTQTDIDQAYRELHGEIPQGERVGEDDGTMQAAVSERDMVASTLGRQVERREPDGATSIGEELVEEGLDEANHDQMLAARFEVDLPDELG